MRYILPILFCLLATTTFAQELKYEMSEPVDVSTAGWDRVLLMPNGNTVFFHFELRKGIIVKIFDRARKEIVSKKHVCSVLDINTLDRTYFDKLIAMNDEAVLFVTQHVDNKETMLRIRINGNTGGLISEDKLVQSASFQKSTHAYFLKETLSDDYYIVCNTIIPGYTEQNIAVQKYNSKHELVETIPLNLEQKNYDKVRLKVSDINTSGGIMIGVELEKQTTQVPDRTLLFAYLPKGAKDFLVTKVALPQYFDLDDINISYNPFAHKVNFLVSSTGNQKTKHGKLYSYTYHSLLLLEEDMSGVKFKTVNNDKINTAISTAIDTNQLFDGSVNRLYTNNNGLSTVIYASSVRDKNAIGLSQKSLGYKPAIGITQFNENGEEVWGTVIPKSILSSDNRTPEVFGRSSNSDIRGTLSIPIKSDIYILFNEMQSNIARTLSLATDSFYTCENSNAVYCKMNKKRDLSKNFLFGQPNSDEATYLITTSNDFDERSNMFATVVRQRKGKQISTKIAWIQL